MYKTILNIGACKKIVPAILLTKLLHQFWKNCVVKAAFTVTALIKW